MSCRLPGGIDSPEKLWESLLRGDDLITEIPAGRWDAEEYYDPERGVPGRSVSRWGGFLDDIAGFDAVFFGIGDREAEGTDPQHRLLLETAWEAVEHAGVAPKSLTGTATGVFVGLAHDDHSLVAYDAGVLDGPYGFTGNAYSMASGRIAYALGLRGPAITIDTACSSGLSAVHLACRSLHERESDMALAGGCMIMLKPEVSASASAQGMLSPTGRCRAFDAAADGFVRSEGCVLVFLKRLEDAVRDGDRILAVVRGTAANQDGRSPTITMPSLEAQVEVYRAALAAAGVNADSIHMVEAHGTGTPIGDPIEFTSLARVYGAGGTRCAVGSVKTNLGHTESAAGALGLIKAVLALRHGMVPANLHFTGLSEELRRIDSGLFVPVAATAWPGGDGPRRAAVSSFGMSGTNMHAVLEQAPAPSGPRDEPGAAAAKEHTLIFPVSATSPEELRRTAARIAEWAERHAGRIAPRDVATTLTRRRQHRPVRAVALASDLPELAARLREVAHGDTPRQAAVSEGDRGPVWVFSGQGSQWAAMGAELLAREPVFAAVVAEIEPWIAREAGFSVTAAMTAPETVTGIDRIQPVLFTMQVAMAAAMEARGVQPSAVIGHSLGEIAAAVVAGVLSLADGVRVICRRSRLCARLAGAGAMASVELSAQLVRAELAASGTTDVVVSVIASPESTVIGGETKAVRRLVEAWERRGVMAREIAVDVASHSPQVDPILADLARELAELVPLSPRVPFYSTTLDDPRSRPACDAAYWVDNLRKPVQFAKAVQAALEDGHRIFAELAPHPLLVRAIEQSARATDTLVAAIASMRRGQPLQHGLLGFVADLHAAGAAVDFSVQCPQGQLVDVPLPTWTHKHLFVQANEKGAASRVARTAGQHPLLGAHVRLPEQPEQHVWQGDLGTAALPWLSDHRVGGVPAFPGAGYCEMAIAAAREVFGEASEVRDVRFEQMLLLDEKSPVTITASVERAGTAALAVLTESDDGERTRRAAAVLRTAAGDDAEPAPLDVPGLLAAHPRRVDGDGLRQQFDALGVQLGPALSGLSGVRVNDADASTLLAEVELPAQIRHQHSAYGVHPALLDACFQALAARWCLDAADTRLSLLLPLGVRLLRAYGSGRHMRYCLVRVTARDGRGIEADLDVVDTYGSVLLVVRGLRLAARVSKDGDQERLLAERLLTVVWEERQPPTDAGQPGAPGSASWLLVSEAGGDDPLPDQLLGALEERGGRCLMFHWPRAALDHADAVERFRALVRSGRPDRVVMIAPPAGEANEGCPDRGLEQVRTLTRIAGELPDLPGDPPRLYVLSRAAQRVLPQDRPNLDQAGLRGLLRVVGAEHPRLHPTQIDVGSTVRVEDLARELLSGTNEDETAWRDGRWYVARLRATPLRPEDRRTTAVRHDRDSTRMHIRTPGDLETLERVWVDRPAPGRGEIEVAVAASSVNFTDVLTAHGRALYLDDQVPDLGLDFAGVVTAVGEGVTGHRVGDWVGGCPWPAGRCWGTFLVCDARLAVSLPPGLAAEQAAAATIAYGTAWYALHDVARIGSGEKVLIHSATGGVGQAALAIARRAGAQVFATAGSPQRRALLAEMGIAHVYDSRTTEFADLIRRDTDGYGVDIVLNSLTGTAQRAGLELLAPNGRFLEIGKPDVYGNTRLGLYPFRRNLAFFFLDLSLLGRTHPERLQAVLRTVYGLLADGSLPPLPTTEYALDDVVTALRTMSAAQHTGKLVLSIPRKGQGTAVLPPERAPVFRSDGAYIITGGLGGLGLKLAARMATAGCGRIVLSSRSQPTEKAATAIRQMREVGCDVHVECGDITEAGTAARLVAAAIATGLPLCGVLHAAAVVEDATLTNITGELIARNWAPKVHGAWHLHHVTAGHPLDWFCSFSSAAALLGSPGQGAYAAANSWLDAFTHWRRSQGLPASAIAWGAWAEIGRGAFLGEDGRTAMIHPEEGAFAFESLLRYDRGYTGYVPVGSAPWLTALAKRSPFAEACRAASADKTATLPLRSELRALPQDEWLGRLRRFVTDQVSLISRRAVDPDRPFNDHGLDSLGNLELRTRIETETGIRLAPKALSVNNTARTLARHLCDILLAEPVS